MMRTLPLLVLALCSCRDSAPGARAPRPVVPAPTESAAANRTAELQPLHDFEEGSRGSVDFAALPSWDQATGTNPANIARIPGTELYIGLLRGADAAVLLDVDARELQRVAAPASPTGLAFSGSQILVSGEASPTVMRYFLHNRQLERGPDLILQNVLGIRDIAAGPEGVVYAVEELQGRLLAVEIETGRMREVDRCHGPVQVERLERALLTNCLLDHAVSIRAVDGSGQPQAEIQRIAHDGPIWAVTAVAASDKPDRDADGNRRPDNGQLLVAATGVENRPLDRSDGSFGYIDSFLYLYRVGHDGAQLQLALNLSERGVITAKWLAMSRDAATGELTVHATGYGGDRMFKAVFGPDLTAEPRRIDLAPVAPGLTYLAVDDDHYIGANALLDAWATPDRVTPIGEDQPSSRSVEVRVGEALFFTKLMAPWNRSEGHLSRFTCETCHYEGYIDGRVHYTGRGEVNAATKPLVGLFNNRPYFSRALDRSMAQMVDNEFRVANRHSNRDPWFVLRGDEFPWLEQLGPMPAELTPAFLRRSLMAFLMTFTHRTNPRVLHRQSFTREEQRGAALFRDHCERCHSARLVADQPRSRVPFERWPELVFSPTGPIVWASADYHKTGVTPYVHERGARVPSLRRLYKKWPYFTNGSALDLDEVLQRAAVVGPDFYHSAAPAGAVGLPDDARRALAGFLTLL
jgi:hypothetical protein